MCPSTCTVVNRVMVQGRMPSTSPACLPRAAAAHGLFVLSYSIALIRGKWSVRFKAGARDHLIWSLLKILLAWVALFLLREGCNRGLSPLHYDLSDHWGKQVTPPLPPVTTGKASACTPLPRLLPATSHLTHKSKSSFLMECLEYL